jgi:hypothetical protein
LRRLLAPLLRLGSDAKAVLEVQEVIAKALERYVVPLRVTVLCVLAQQVKHGGECPEVIVRPDMELDGFLRHASIVGEADKIKIKKR